MAQGHLCPSPSIGMHNHISPQVLLMVSHSHTIERHRLGIQLPTVPTSMTPQRQRHQSAPTPHLSLVSYSFQMAMANLTPARNTQKSLPRHTGSVALATIVPLSTNPQLPGQGQGVGSPWCDHLGMLKKDLSLCHGQFSSNHLSGAL